LTRRSTSLRLQLILGMLAITAFAALLFSVLTLAFAYSVEDTLFEQELIRHGEMQRAHWRETGGLADTGSDHIRIYRDPLQFPADLARAYAENPDHPEFRGDGGNHYQVLSLDLPDADGFVWLVADVSDQQVVPNLREKMIGFLIVTTLVILTIVGVLAWLLANRATAPLLRLAGNVSSQGPEQVPHVAAIDYPANEIGRLADALQAAFERIRAFVMRERSFTRDISHELRTPLAVMRGAAELMQGQPHLPESITAPLARIVEAERRMEETVALLLALAREEGQGAGRERVRLSPLVEVAVLSASDRFGGAERQVAVDVPGDAEAVLNRAGFVLILDNLIGNAFQHAPDHRLDITLEGATLMIASGGPGIPDAVAARAGQPFAKGADSDGLGLGLSIVKRLCERDDIPMTLTASGEGVVVRLGLHLATAPASP
jgi:signal transduction histidine kinase